MVIISQENLSLKKVALVDGLRNQNSSGLTPSNAENRPLSNAENGLIGEKKLSSIHVVSANKPSPPPPPVDISNSPSSCRKNKLNNQGRRPKVMHKPISTHSNDVTFDSIREHLDLKA